MGPGFYIIFLIFTVEFLGLTLGERCDFYFQNEKAKENFNKRLILDFYQEGFTNPQNLAAAIDKYTVAKGYIQHNPGLAEGKEGFIAAIPRLFGNSTAPAVAFINNVVADGDFVWVHEKHILPSRTASLVNIFRLECGWIMEHWDCIQGISPNATYANPHPFF